jgi:hypothetical protein
MEYAYMHHENICQLRKKSMRQTEMLGEIIGEKNEFQKKKTIYILEN